MTAMSDSV